MTARDTQAWGTLAPGGALPPWTAPPVGRTGIVRYQGASGDFDPAHHDDAHARSFGYPGVFSLGMLHAGELAAYVERLFGPGSARRFRAKFKGVVVPGDVLTFSGRVASVSAGGAVLDLLCAKADGSPVIEGSAEVAR